MRPVTCRILFVIATTFISIASFSLSANAQSVRGVITDAETGEPLPSATVLYEGTFRGTIANLEGEFSIEVDGFPAQLLIRYIGYQSETITLTGRPGSPIEVEMKPSVTELDEIVVTDQDPGLSIMERVIAKKQIWREDLETYVADAFTRQVLKNDTSIVSITESGTRSFWDDEKGHREVQLYRRQTTNIGDDQNFAGVSFLPNFYDDNITVAGYEMVGITNPDALEFYDFSLRETTRIDDVPVYIIDIIPARRLQPLFTGTAYVHGGDYALLEVDLKPNRVVSFPPPVQEFDLSYRQQYRNFSGDVWLPVDMRINGTVLIEMVGLRIPSINFSQTSRLSEYKVNVELPDSLYRQEEVFTRAEVDTVEASTFSQQMVPLTREEEQAFETIDSTNTLQKAFEPEGFLSRFITESSEEPQGGAGIGSFLPRGLQPVGRFNRVDGFNAGLSYTRSVSDIGLTGNAYASYSFHADFFNYGAGFRQRLPFNFGESNFYIEGNYDNKITETYAGSLYSTGMNSVQVLIGGVDYFDYYSTQKFRTGAGIQRLFPKTDVSLHFISENGRSLASTEEAVYDYSLFGWHKDRRANPAVFEGDVRSLEFRIDLNRQSTNFGVSGNRQLSLVAERAESFLGSDATFTRLAVSGSWNMQTFYQRRVFANTLDVQFSAGILRGDKIPQKFGVIDGTLSGFSPFGTLKTRQERPYAGSEYWMISAEHNFRTIPFEIIGLRGLADRGWGIILFGGAGYSRIGNDDDLLTPDFMALTTDDIHTEMGISLNSIFGILRLDFAKRLDAAGHFIGFSVPRYF